jgi:predicted ATPase/DNA-binding CsgD family transcriptional regulator/exonuclease VII small subunit
VEDSSPPTRSDGARPRDLRAQLTSFVGRERELAEIERLLKAARLVTLTGPAGSGKTRLSIEVARRWADRQRRSVCFVDLASVTDGEQVPGIVAIAAGIQSVDSRPLTDVLLLNLKDSDGLILMDNCEHLVDACAQFVELLLGGCPNLRLLCTSRERLRVPGEANRPVPPLTLPDPRLELDPASLARYEAVQLFVARSRLSRPDFTIRPAELRVVAQICHRLDGMPLAIELAAARVGLLGVEEILVRLQDCFQLLTGGGRTAVSRHKTLRAAVEWSYNLLGEAEKVAFMRLSVFAGGFDLQAAEAVTAGEPLLAGAGLDVLDRLVDKSLVVAERTEDGSIRFRLLETLRQYAAARLAERDEQEAVRRCHGLYYLALARTLAVSRTAEAYGKLDRELANLQSALSWCVSAEADPCASVSGLSNYWGARGLALEGRTWLGRAIARSPRTRATARALVSASWLAQRQSDYETCARQLAEARAIALELGDDQLVAEADKSLGDMARHCGDFASACDLLERSLPEFETLGDRFQTAMTRMMLGHARGCLGDLERGQSELEESLREFAEARAPSVYANYCHMWLADLELQAGHATSAQRRLTEALTCFWALNDVWLIAYVLDELAWVAALKRDPVRALRLAGSAGRLRELTGTNAAVAFRRRVEGGLATARADLGSKAAAAWNEGRAMDRAAAVGYALGQRPWSAPPVPDAVQIRRRGESGLTRRETEVASLVADGLTDAEIARQLRISQRTAEFHVERVRNKLGVRSRVQIATWVASGARVGSI